MSRKARWGFLALVAVQALVLVGIAGAAELRLRSGREVVLQTTPVDPRDLFRGDYVTLHYEISTIPAGFHRYEVGDPVFVRLVREGTAWSAAGTSPELRDGDEPTIRGTVIAVHRDAVLDVVYGIETYFVPEGRGFEIETADDVDVVAVVDRTGRAAIKHLIVDGDVWVP